MLGASCKKIVLQFALQDIGQLTDFGSTAAQPLPRRPDSHTGRPRIPARARIPARPHRLEAGSVHGSATGEQDPRQRLASGPYTLEVS